MNKEIKRNIYELTIKVSKTYDGKVETKKFNLDTIYRYLSEMQCQVNGEEIHDIIVWEDNKYQGYNVMNHNDSEVWDLINIYGVWFNLDDRYIKNWYIDTYSYQRENGSMYVPSGEDLVNDINKIISVRDKVLCIKKGGMK